MFFSETACDCEVWKIDQVPEFARDHMVVMQDYRGTGREQTNESIYDRGLRRRRNRDPGSPQRWASDRLEDKRAILGGNAKRFFKL